MKFTHITAAMAVLIGLQVWADVNIPVIAKANPTVVVNNNTPNSVAIQGWRFWSADSKYNSSVQGITTKVSSVSFGGHTWYQSVIDQSAAWARVIPANGSSQAMTYPWATYTDDGNSPSAMLSEGTCSGIPPIQDAAAIDTNQLKLSLQSSAYYDATWRYIDTLGSNGGQYSGGWIDTYYGQTQMEIATPSATININGGIKWDPANLNTMTWMSLAMAQEFFHADNQYLIANSLKETSFGTSAYNCPSQAGVYGPFQVESPTFGSRAQGYGKFFPYSSCINKASAPGVPVDLTSGLQQCGLASDVAFANSYLEDPANSSFCSVNSPYIVNYVFASVLVWQFNYELLSDVPCAQFRNVLANAKDRMVGICMMAPIYNIGLWGAGNQIIAQLENAANVQTIINTPPTTCGTTFAPGNNNYSPDMMTAASVITQANVKAKTDPTVPIYDTWITLAQIQQFYFGEGGDYTTTGASQKGGLMRHFNIGASQQTAMWNEIQRAFQLQSQHWPMQGGVPVISLRYDWLSNLRIAKKYLDLTWPSLLTANGDAATWLGGQTCVGATDPNGKPFDTQAPFESATSVGSGDTLVWTVQVDEPNTNDRGVQKVVWTFNDDWTNFSNQGVQSASGTPLSGQWTITLGGAIIDSARAQGKSMWIKAVDSCGNATVIKSAIGGGVRLPKITQAVIKDMDGNGIADYIRVDGSSDTLPNFNSFTTANYNWPTSADNHTVANSSVLQWNGNNEFSFSDTTLGAITNESALSGSIQLIYSQGKISASLIDSVGPVIMAAGMKEKSDTTAPDTLNLVFNRSVGGFNDSIPGVYFTLSNGSHIIPLAKSLSQVSPNSFIFVFAKGTIHPGVDSIWIWDSSSVIATANGVHAAANNQHVLINLWKGPLMLASTGNVYLDKNSDGQMDAIQLQFDQVVDQSRLAGLKISFLWMKQLKSGTKAVWYTIPSSDLKVVGSSTVEYDIPASDSLAQNLTWFDGKTWGALNVVQAKDFGATDSLTQNPVMKDGMGPVIVKAELIRTSNPDAQPDYVDVQFSEPLRQSQVKDSTLYLYQESGVVESNYNHAGPNDPKAPFQWYNQGQRLRVGYTPKLVNRPSIGDSIKLTYDPTILGLVVDSAGNLPSSDNPWRILGGKLNFVFFANDLVRNFNDSGKTQVFDKLLFFDGRSHKDSVIDNALPGLGIHFAFADSSQSAADRQNVQIHYQVMIYDQIGAYVASVSGVFGCTDMQNTTQDTPDPQVLSACNPVSVGANRDMVAYIPWNMRSQDGRSVGSGPYIFSAQAWSEQGSKGLLQKATVNKTLGVVRYK